MGVQELMHTCTALSPVQKYYSHLLPRSIIQEAQRWKHTNMSVITRSSFKRCIWSRMYTLWQWCMGPQSLAVVPEKYQKLKHFQVKNSAPSVKVGTSPLLFLREVSKYLGKGRPSQTRGYGTCVRTSVCLSVTTSSGMFISTLKLRYEHLYSGILLNF